MYAIAQTIPNTLVKIPNAIYCMFGEAVSKEICSMADI
jgi:hypothetical protein